MLRITSATGVVNKSKEPIELSVSGVIAAGTTAVNTAPLKFSSQSAGLTTVEAGAMEYIGHSLQFSQYLKRRGVMMSESVVIADVTADNTATETAALLSAQHGANYLEAGKCEKLVLVGTLSQRNNANSFLKIYIYYGATKIDSVSTPSTTTIAAGSLFELKIYITCRTTGTTGTVQINTAFSADGVAIVPDPPALKTINTTTSDTFSITAKWNEAHASNLFTMNQGYVECIEPNR